MGTQENSRRTVILKQNQNVGFLIHLKCSFTKVNSALFVIIKLNILILHWYMGKMIQLLIRGYRICVSPYIRPCCRYLPTCSQYADECIERFGVTKGLWLSMKRIVRCHPFADHGLDPVPDVCNPTYKNGDTQ